MSEASRRFSDDTLKLVKEWPRILQLRRRFPRRCQLLLERLPHEFEETTALQVAVALVGDAAPADQSRQLATAHPIGRLELAGKLVIGARRVVIGPPHGSGCSVRHRRRSKEGPTGRVLVTPLP